jgi:hypothetical protein
MRTLLTVLIACACLVTAGALVQAQDAPGGNQGADEGGQAAGPMTKDQMEQAGLAIVKRGTVLSKSVSKLLNDARKENDIIKVTCLNNKLTQINANLRNAQRRLSTLRGAVDTDQANHEFIVLKVVNGKLETLEKEAAQCVGQDLFETGSTKVVTEIDTSQLPFENNPSIPPVVLPPTLPTLPPPASGRR